MCRRPVRVRCTKLPLRWRRVLGSPLLLDPDSRLRVVPHPDVPFQVSQFSSARVQQVDLPDLVRLCGRASAVRCIPRELVLLGRDRLESAPDCRHPDRRVPAAVQAVRRDGQGNDMFHAG